MSAVKTLQNPAVNLTDESFDLKRSNTCHLSMLTDDKNLSLAILDTNTNKYLVLRSLTAANSQDILEPVRNAGFGTTFKSVTCAVAHPKFTPVPAALFDEENKKALHGFNHPAEEDEKIHSDTLRNLEAKNIFTLPKNLQTAVRNQFPNVHFLHNSTAFIEGTLAHNKNKPGKRVFADFHSSYFEVLILEGGNLLFSNAFRYKTPEDIAYYILFVYEQLHLNPEETELMLSGEIEKTAQEHALLYNYIRHVKFAGLPESFKYSYKFDEIPSHRFISLFNQYLCV